jgi:hypothetical protein
MDCLVIAQLQQDHVNTRTLTIVLVFCGTVCAYGSTTDPGRQKDLSGWLITYLWAEQSCATSAGDQLDTVCVFLSAMHGLSLAAVCRNCS